MQGKTYGLEKRGVHGKSLFRTIKIQKEEYASTI